MVYLQLVPPRLHFENYFIIHIFRVLELYTFQNMGAGRDIFVFCENKVPQEVLNSIFTILTEVHTP